MSNRFCFNENAAPDIPTRRFFEVCPHLAFGGFFDFLT